MNNVDHPAHYQSDGFEAIDIIAAFTKELKGIEAFDVGNAIKYLLRWNKKNGAEDIDKAIWYLVHLKNHLKEKEKQMEQLTKAVSELTDQLAKPLIKKTKQEEAQKADSTYDLEYPNGEKIHVENGKINADDYLKQLEKEEA